MQFRAFETTDLACLKDFEPPNWGDLTPRFTYFLQSPFCKPIKLLINQQMVAIGTSISHQNTAWLACIIVHEQHRNKGLGKLITQQLINNIDSEKCKTIYLDATEMGYPVYKKLGFEIDTEYAHLKAPTIRHEQQVSDLMVSFDPKFTAQLFALDQQVSGEERSVLLSEHLASAKLYLNHAALEGFYMPTLADGLIVANTQNAGIELIKHRLQTNDFAALPINNTLAIHFLEQQNWQIYRTSKRMFWGKKRTWQPQNLYNRISGQLG